MEAVKVNITSEIGQLESVVIHQPGPEIENMIPEHAARSLYSDILNLSEASQEYAELKRTLNKFCNVFEISDLLYDILKKDNLKEELINKNL
jgi:arginine deiminase